MVRGVGVPLHNKHQVPEEESNLRAHRKIREGGGRFKGWGVKNEVKL